MASLFESESSVQERQDAAARVKANASNPRMTQDVINDLRSQVRANKSYNRLKSFDNIKAGIDKSGLLGDYVTLNPERKRASDINSIKEKVTSQHKFGTPAFFKAAATELAAAGYTQEALSAIDKGLTFSQKQATLNKTIYDSTTNTAEEARKIAEENRKEELHPYAVKEQDLKNKASILELRNAYATAPDEIKQIMLKTQNDITVLDQQKLDLYNAQQTQDSYIATKNNEGTLSTATLQANIDKANAESITAEVNAKVASGTVDAQITKQVADAETAISNSKITETNANLAIETYNNKIKISNETVNKLKTELEISKLKLDAEERTQNTNIRQRYLQEELVKNQILTQQALANKYAAEVVGSTTPSPEKKLGNELSAAIVEGDYAAAITASQVLASKIPSLGGDKDLANNYSKLKNDAERFKSLANLSETFLTQDSTGLAQLVSNIKSGVGAETRALGFDSNPLIASILDQLDPIKSPSKEVQAIIDKEEGKRTPSDIKELKKFEKLGQADASQIQKAYLKVINIAYAKWKTASRNRGGGEGSITSRQLEAAGKAIGSDSFFGDITQVQVSLALAKTEAVKDIELSNKVLNTPRRTIASRYLKQLSDSNSVNTPEGLKIYKINGKWINTDFEEDKRMDRIQ